MQCLVSVVQFRTCQSGLVCLVCVRLLCQVSLVCVHLVVVVVFVDVGLLVGLSNVGCHFVVVVVVVGHVCVAVVGVLFVVRPSLCDDSVVQQSVHVHEAAGSFLCTEHKTNHSHRILEAHLFFSTELGYRIIKPSLAFSITGPSLGEWFENWDLDQNPV